MKRKYYTLATRSALVKYLAWEFGVANANLNIKQAVKHDSGLYIVPDYCFGDGKLKREADGLAQRVEQAAAYIDGKLGNNGFGAMTRVIHA